MLNSFDFYIFSQHALRTSQDQMEFLNYFKVYIFDADNLPKNRFLLNEQSYC